MGWINFRGKEATTKTTKIYTPRKFLRVRYQLSIAGKSSEGGGLPVQQRDITAHIEDDREHTENIINFVCSYLWSKMILDSK